MRQFVLIFFVMGIVAGAVANNLQGTPLPEAYPLLDADLERLPEDKNLQSWMGQHFMIAEPKAADPQELQRRAEQEDAITASYIRLRALGDNKDRKPLLKESEALKGLLDDLEKKHPIAALAYYELIKQKLSDDSETADFREQILNKYSGTCAHKKLVYDEITSDSLKSLSLADLQKYIDRSQQFRSVLYRKNALKKMISQVPKNKRTDYTPAIFNASREWKDVVGSSSWLKKSAAKMEVEGLEQPYKGYLLVKEAARKRRCSTAKGHLLDAVKGIDKPTADHLNEAVDSAKLVGSCYRRRGAKARRDFWAKIGKPLRDTFGFRGWVESQSRIGYLYWTADDFDKAKDIFLDIIAKAMDEKDKTSEAKAIFALARVAENEGKPVDAEAYYSDYAKRFEGLEDYHKALMASVLLAIDRRDWQAAERPLEQILVSKSKNPDGVEDSTVAFALFWSGRINMVLGKKDLAKERWRQLASEHYSTFYGAMGHYMLEEALGKKLALQPVRNPKFRMHVMRNAFGKEDRRRILRAEKLLRLGYRDEALCEIAELDISDKPDRKAVRALLLSATGQWLDAIRTYSAIPRSFRNSLPIGFEKILFPVRFKETIDKYAAKAGVDPDLVKAIIRQESVFNATARSPVGAMGLMQLMPATARLEARRLSKDYLPKKTRSSLQRKVKRRANLHNPDVNIALGVHHVRHLLKLYESPVFALSAYNASPRAARSWMASIPTHDMLAFVERIPYKETRAYVKLVLRNYFYYKRWYRGASPALSHLETVSGPLVTVVKEDDASIDLLDAR